MKTKQSILWTAVEAFMNISSILSLPQFRKRVNYQNLPSLEFCFSKYLFNIISIDRNALYNISSLLAFPFPKIFLYHSFPSSEFSFIKILLHQKYHWPEPPLSYFPLIYILI